MRKYAYICAPFRGNLTEIIRNFNATRQYCKDIVEAGEDCIPVAPQIYFSQFLDEDNEKSRAIGMLIGLMLLEYCDEIRVYGNRITEGMEAEIGKARALGIPIVRMEAKV